MAGLTSGAWLCSSGTQVYTALSRRFEHRRNIAQLDVLCVAELNPGLLLRLLGNHDQSRSDCKSD